MKRLCASALLVIGHALWSGPLGAAPPIADLTVNGVPWKDAKISTTESVRLTLSFTDPATGESIAGLQPVGWVLSGNRIGCRGPIGRAQAALSERVLHGSSLLVTGRDGSVVLVDPRFSIGAANAQYAVKLNGEPGASAYDLDTGLLAIAIPEAKSLAILNVESGALVRDIALGFRPDDVAAARNGRFWVTHGGSVSLIDAPQGETVLTEIVGGETALLATHEDRVAVSGSDRTILLHGDGALIADYPMEAAPTALVILDAANAAAVAVGGPPQLLLMAFEQDVEPWTVPLATNADRLTAVEEGRRIAALDSRNGSLEIVDVALSRRTHAFAFAGQPDDVFATERFVYLRLAGAPRWMLLSASKLDETEKLAAVGLAIGSGAPGAAPQRDGQFVEMPEGGVVLLHGPDRTAFVFSEGGMQAPDSAVRLPVADPVSIIAIDRRIREIAPGVYEALVAFDQPGPRQLVLRLIEREDALCFSLTVSDS